MVKIIKASVMYDDLWVPPITLITPTSSCTVLITENNELFIVDTSECFKQIFTNSESKDIPGFIFPKQITTYRIAECFKIISQYDTIFEITTGSPFDSPPTYISYYVSLLYNKIVTKERLEAIQIALLKEKIDINEKYKYLINKI